MAADIYALMRGVIGDENSPYVVADMRIMKYLDAALDKFSEIKPITYMQDLTVTSTDKTNGFVLLDKEVVSLMDMPVGWQGVSWEVDSKNKLRLIDPDNIPEDTYEDVRYYARYKKFDGVIRENTYFDYPREADLAVVFYALGLFQEENGIINADGAMKFAKSKSEEGMSITYGSMGGSEEVLGAPSTLMRKAVRMMQNLPGSRPIFLSV